MSSKDDAIRKAVERYNAEVPQESEERANLEIPRWPLGYEALVRAIDAYCLDVSPVWGDRVAVTRHTLGDGIRWTFTLDDIEIGSLRVAPGVESGYERRESATALSRGARGADRVTEIPDVERERHELFGAIMSDLDHTLEVKSGVCKPGGRLTVRQTYRTQAPEIIEEIRKAELDETESKVLDMWVGGYTGPEIARVVGLAPGTVQNKITSLRKDLGEEIVPYHS